MEKSSTLDMLRKTPVATLTTMLKQSGVRSTWMQGPRPLAAGQARIAGPAYTLRFVPMREDIPIAEAIEGVHSPRAAIAHMPEGCVVVADAMGCRSVGLLGDIVCARMKVVGVAGLVTDGAMRDHAGLTNLGWPIWCDGISAPPSTTGLYCADTQVPVACGGVTIFPGDIIVADEDGSVVLPQALADKIAAEAFEENQFESWVYEQVVHGAPLGGLYPPNDETRRRYAASRRGANDPGAS